MPHLFLLHQSDGACVTSVVGVYVYAGIRQEIEVIAATQILCR